MGDRLATTDMGRKLGDAVPLWAELGPHLTKYVAWAEVYLRTKLHLDPSSRLATIHKTSQTDRQGNVL